jgi:Na+:H+ antiporter, NhaA family
MAAAAAPGGAAARGGGRAPIDAILEPFRQFAHAQAAGGIVLIACTVLALAWANSPWRGAYDALWHTELTVGVGRLVLSKGLAHWINDGLMAIFFFVVGLEIKREVLAGELASPRQAALPIAAALGGMAVPAAFYAAVNTGGPGAPGWGIPMATDIAFALGILSLLGPRAPLPLKIFLAALAIVDDIGAVLVIALFYNAGISWPALGAAALCVAMLAAANRLGVRAVGVYAALGVALWVAVLLSGVHATIAGVLLALTIPVRSRIDAPELEARSRDGVEAFRRRGAGGADTPPTPAQQAALLALERAVRHAGSPLLRLEQTLHPWVAFAIMPLFALANAGVDLQGGAAAALRHPVGLGVIAGLVLGKPIGITLAAWLLVRSGLGALPAGVGWRQIAGAGCLGGIGFTMSLFIAGLAFGDGPILPSAKIGILAASIAASLAGAAMLRVAAAPRPS